MTEAGPYVLLFFAGLIAGTVNVIAGGGSFLTLPILIFLGLPATVANGTNRVAILLQNVGAVWGFHRERVLYWRWALLAGAPATVGAVIGTWAALQIGDQAFQRILAFLMVALTLGTLLRRDGIAAATAQERVPARPAVLALGFLGVGLYGGFVQAGVGFLILAVTTLAGLDLVRGNAVKVTTVLVYMSASLLIFALSGKVDWALGLALAAGNVVGGLIGVRLTIRKGHRWVRGFVTVAVIVFAIRLWVTS